MGVAGEGRRGKGADKKGGHGTPDPRRFSGAMSRVQALFFV